MSGRGWVRRARGGRLAAVRPMLAPISLLLCWLLGPVGTAPAQNSPPGLPQTTVPSSPALTQPPTPTENVDILPAEQLAARIELVQGTPDLPDAVKAKAIEHYQQAQAALTTTTTYQARIDEYNKKLKEASNPTSDEAEVTSLGEEPNPNELSLAQLDRWLQQKRAQLEQARSELSQVSTDSDQRSARRADIPRQLATMTERVAELDRQLTAPPEQGEHSMLTSARRTMLATQRQSLQKNMEALRKELAYYDNSADWLLKRRETFQRKVDKLDEQLQKWQEIVNAKREEDVAYQVEAAQRRRDNAPPALVPLAQRNLELAQQRKQIDDQLKQSRFDAEELDRQYESWSKEVDRIRKEIGTRTEVTEAIGFKLREQRSKLPDLRELERNRSARLRLINEVRSRRFELEADQAELLNIERAELNWSKANIPSQSDVPEVRRLFQAQRDLVNKLLADYDALFDVLVKTDGIENQLTELTRSYQEFVDEHVLWIRSADNVVSTKWSHLTAAVQWWGDSAQWRQLGQIARRSMWRAPWIPVMALAVAVVFYVAGRRWRRRLTVLGERARSRSCREYGLTLNAFGLTVAIAAFWPLILLLLGWWLLWIAPELDLAMALAAGLQAAAITLFPLEMLRQLMRPFGLCEAHFDLGNHAVTFSRQRLRNLTFLFVPLVGFYTAIRQLGNADWENTLARLVLLAIFLIVGVFMHRMLHPTRGAIRDFLAYNSTGWISRLRRVWYPSIHLTAAALIVLVLIGYQYTAEHLSQRIHWSILYLGALWLAIAMFRRWVLVSRRRLAMQQARDRLAAARAVDPGSSGTALPVTVDTGEVDLAQADLQTRRLIHGLSILTTVVALWLIWVDVLPALSRLDSWQFGTIAMESPTSAAGDVRNGGKGPAAVQPTVISVSLADVILALLVFGTVLIATANIPGLFELILLQNLPLDQALRFAITTVTRYLIFLVGVIWSLRTLGVTWTSVQWLVAAVSVGLGFGLQEIFANFISGLIILFERPLRAGDIVTVGDISGRVVNIRMRATTVEDWDGKELIVPNKDFITGKLLNWTLADTANRIVMKIGLRYGADVRTARRVIWETISVHPNVMSEPAPTVTFDLFGESNLQLTIRAFVPNLDCRLDTVNDLHTACYENLRAAGFEIPFPQRDIQIRWADPGVREQLLGGSHTSPSRMSSTTGNGPQPGRHSPE